VKTIIKSIIFGAFVVLAASAAHAGSFTLDTSTNIPTGSPGEFTAGGYPNKAGSLYVRSLILANSGATVQTVSIYTTATSSTAATLAGKVVLASTGTTQVDFPAQTFKLTSPAIIKSATGSNVQATVIYQ
jgi:hypothetical protein